MGEPISRLGCLRLMVSLLIPEFLPAPVRIDSCAARGTMNNGVNRRAYARRASGQWGRDANLGTRCWQLQSGNAART